MLRKPYVVSIIFYSKHPEKPSRRFSISPAVECSTSTSSLMKFQGRNVLLLLVSLELTLALVFPPVCYAYSFLNQYASQGAVGFSGQDFSTAVKKLVNAGTGYYPFEDLLVELGKGNNANGYDIVKALIEKNVLHYRSKPDDLDPMSHEPVVTAMSQPALRAMELIMANRNWK